MTKRFFPQHGRTPNFTVKRKPSTKRARNSAVSASSAVNRLSNLPSIDWIPELAEPYLRGYAPERETGGGLRGWRFLSPSRTRGTRLGFFVGFLAKTRGWNFLEPQTPEFLIFAFVQPVGGAAHTELVAADSGLVRQTFEYIRWLTHRPPRFQFFDKEAVALVRRTPLRLWPEKRIEHYARNFTIETLAWLVRSALVRKLGSRE